MRLVVPAVAAAVSLAGCSRDMSVPPLRPLSLAPATSTIAPRQQLTFAAAGGASGYRYAFSGAPGSGSDAAVDAATGAYRAGSTGPATDVVQVTDQAGAIATATVTVGTALTISPPVALVAPGGRVTFAADGGLPPYTFRFRPKGNRSFGRIDGVSGVYTAGPNPGAIDRLEVVDAAGAVAMPLLPVYVGALHFPLPGGASELELADLNGDGRADVVALEPQPSSGPRRVTTAMLLPGGASVSDTYFMPYVNAVSALDLTGDGRADVLVAGSGGSSGSTAYLPDPSGHLVQTGTYGLAITPRLPYVVALQGYSGCATGGGTGIYQLAWNAGTGTFDASTCVTGISAGDTSHVGDVLSGDFDATYTKEVAWLERDSYSGPIYGTGTPQLHYATATPRVLPIPAGGWSAVLPAGGSRQQVVGGNFRGTGFTDTAVLLANPSARNVLKIVPSFTTSTPPAWAGGALDPFPSGPSALGIARCGALPGMNQETLATWNGTLKPEVLTVDGSGTASVSSAYVPSVYVPITVGACGDVNGDGVPDLAVASDSTSTMAVIWGDGDGGFGRRPHFYATPVFTMAQIDGDGIGDVVVATDAPSLLTLLGDEHQLAAVAESPITFAPAGLWAGDLGGGPLVLGWAGDLVIADTSSNLYMALGTPWGVYGKANLVRPAPTFAGRIPRIVRVAFATLGGVGPGQDLAVLYELSPPGTTPGGPVAGSYELDAIVRTTGAPQVITYAFTSFVGTDVQPVDLDHDGVDELVVAEGAASKGGPPYWRAQRLKVDRSGAGAIAFLGHLPGFTQANQLPLTAVGRVGDTAAFVSASRAELVWGAGPAVDFGVDPEIAVTTLPGGLAAPLPRMVGNVMAPGVALGRVTAPLGVPDLVFADGSGGLRVLPGVLAGFRLAGFAPGTVARAPGTFAGVVAQGLLAPADVLVFTGEELVPLVWTGGALK